MRIQYNFEIVLIYLVCNSASRLLGVLRCFIHLGWVQIKRNLFIMFVSFLSYHNIQASKKMERASVFVNTFIHKVLDFSQSAKLVS